MDLIGISVRRPVLTSVIMIIAVLLGLYSFSRLGVTLLPKLDIPVVQVRVPYKGANPLEVERLVVRPVEDAIATVEGVTKITGYALEGMAYVMAEIAYETDITQATLDISTRVKSITAALPDDADEPVVRKFDINARPFLILVVNSPLPAHRVRDMADDRIARALTQVPGMAAVDLFGGRVREIHLNVTPLTLRTHGLSLEMLSNLVKDTNFNSPSGHIASGLRETTVRVVGEPVRPEDLGKIGISLHGGRSLRLGDVATVEDGFAEERTRARYDGRDAVLLELVARPNENIVRIAGDVRRELARLERSLPEGFSIGVVYDGSEFVEKAIRNVIRDMITGTVLTALILFLFLQRMGATVAVAVAMPTAIIATFIPMYLAGFTLNIMSTLGLAVSVGVLVNNSILVLENIYRYRELGEGPESAAIKGTKEIAASVLSTTATNLGVFIPVAFMGGMVGQMFREFALTVVFSTLFSLWMAFTVTPMAAARLGSEGKPVSRTARFLTGWWQWLYGGLEDLHHLLLGRAMRHPLLTVGFFVLLFAGSLMLSKQVGFEYAPRVDQGTIAIGVTLSSTASLEATDEVLRYVEATLAGDPRIRSMSTTLAGGRSGVNSGRVRVYLVEESERPSAFRIASEWRRRFANVADADISVEVASQRGGSRGKPVEVTIAGEDLDELSALSERVKDAMRTVEGLVDIDTDWKVGRQEIRLIPRHNRFAELGISLKDVAEELRGYLSGIESGVFRDQGLEYDILVQLHPAFRANPSVVAGLPVWTPGGFVPFGELAEVEYTQGPTAIYRLDRQRTVTVNADVAGRSVGDVVTDLRKKLDVLAVPPGYRFLFRGEAEDIQENYGRLYAAFGMAVVLTFLMIAGILESYIYALVIMLTVPLAVIGVYPALLLSGVAVSIYGLLGMVMLVGLVVNNAIVIVDYAEILRKDGKDPALAVEEAVSVRLRPVIMADVTTLIAMLPLALGLGTGGQYRAPMAIVLCGGLLAGGTLAVFLIPPIYVGMWRLQERFIRRRLQDA